MIHISRGICAQGTPSHMPHICTPWYSWSRRASPSHATARFSARVTTKLTAHTRSTRGGGAPTARARVSRGSSPTRTPRSVGSSRGPPSKWPCAVRCGPTAPSSRFGRQAVALAVRSSFCLLCRLGRTVKPGCGMRSRHARASAKHGYVLTVAPPLAKKKRRLLNRASPTALT